MMHLIAQNVAQGFGLGVGFFIAWHTLQFIVGIFEGKKGGKE